MCVVLRKEAGGWARLLAPVTATLTPWMLTLLGKSLMICSRGWVNEGHDCYSDN